jgi:hypothetical protein
MTAVLFFTLLMFLGCIPAAKIVATFKGSLSGCGGGGGRLILFWLLMMFVFSFSIRVFWFDSTRSLQVHFPEFFTNIMMAFSRWGFVIVILFSWFLSLMSPKMDKIEFFTDRHYWFVIAFVVLHSQDDVHDDR